VTRLLLDTNVPLDVLLKREPWLQHSGALWQASDAGRFYGFITATSVTTIFYVARRVLGIVRALNAVDVCLEAFEVCPVTRATLKQARALSGSDFEDNVQIACAMIAGLDAIVTRDPRGFRASPIPALTPAEALSRIG